MRLIDADTLVERINALYEWCEDERKKGLEQAMCIIHEQPTAIGECKDCKSADFYPYNKLIYCLKYACVMAFDGFCHRFECEVNNDLVSTMEKDRHTAIEENAK